MEQFCFRMPKCELHAHLSGSVSMETLELLIARRQERDTDFVGLNQDERKLLNSKAQRSMAEVFTLFPLVQRLIRTKEDLRIVTEHVIADFAAENVVYLELRSTPKETDRMSKREYVDTVVECIHACASLYPNIVVRLVLSVDRRQSPEDAYSTLQLAVALSSITNGVVVGAELSGDPRCDARRLLPSFKWASHIGLPITLHVAEMKEHLDELEECLQLKPNRIGHGTFINGNTNENLQATCTEFVIANKIPVEICLTSNMICNTASFSDSHLGFYLSKHHPVVLCTDDRGLMNCSLSGEYAIAATVFGLSREDLFQLSLTSLHAAFIHSHSESRDGLDTIISRYTKFADEENLQLDSISDGLSNTLLSQGCQKNFRRSGALGDQGSTGRAP